LGAQFQKYLQLVLPAILDGEPIFFGRLLTSELPFDSLTKLVVLYDVLGLADENESVRDAALGAGHVLVEHHATTYEFTLYILL